MADCTCQLPQEDTASLRSCYSAAACVQNYWRTLYPNGPTIIWACQAICTYDTRDHEEYYINDLVDSDMFLHLGPTEF